MKQSDSQKQNIVILRHVNCPHFDIVVDNFAQVVPIDTYSLLVDPFEQFVEIALLLGRGTYRAMHRPIDLINQFFRLLLAYLRRNLLFATRLLRKGHHGEVHQVNGFVYVAHCDCVAEI